jgi:hypothetical protein
MEAVKPAIMDWPADGETIDTEGAAELESAAVIVIAELVEMLPELSVARAVSE